MVIVGLVLVLAAGIFGVDLAAKNRFSFRQIQVFGENIGVSGSARLYIVGAITGAVLLLGLMLFFAGLRRKGAQATARRRERKVAGAQHGELQELRQQNADLRQQLDQRDADGRSGGGRGVRQLPTEPPRSGSSAD